MVDLNPNNRCHGDDGCKHCGMDMDLEPFCVNDLVLALRTAETGREYPWGLDVNPARSLCKGKFFDARAALQSHSEGDQQ